MYKRHLTYLLLVMSLTCFTTTISAQYIEKQSTTDAPNVAYDTFSKDADQLFNFDWSYHFGPCKGAEKSDFDDSAWRKLDLPHDFQFEMPWDSLADKGRGYKGQGEAWYRKHFSVPSAWKGKKVLLDFGGIMYYGDVYVNGHKAYSSEYGYIGFDVDITKFLKFPSTNSGQASCDNVVAVYCNTAKTKASRWYTGGGIFRDVYLRLRNTTRIARHGIFVNADVNVLSDESQQAGADADWSPSTINHKPSTVNIQVEVDRWHNHGNVHIDAVIKDASGNIVGKTGSGMPDHMNQTCTEVKLPAIQVNNPHLWDINDPYLYTAEVTITADSVISDRESVNFGIRSIEFSPEFGFKLNGRKVWLQGMSNHHDMGALGAASFDAAIEREMRTLKSFGYNAIRCSHNPYSESFTKIADRVGLLIVDELIDKWSDNEYWGGRKPFLLIWPDLLKEMVKRDRNSPSVILWSLGNELQTRSDWSGYNTNDWGITTYRMMNVVQKRYDPTRLSTVAMFPARAGAQRGTKDFWQYLVPPELSCVTEVSSFNYQWMAYEGYYKFKPDLILFQSEAVTREVLGPFWGMDHKRGVGLSYWGPIEYWGESDGWPKKGWNYSFFSSTLQPYPQAYCIKSAFKQEEPLVRIGVKLKDDYRMWNDVKVGKTSIEENWNNTIQRPVAEPTHKMVYTYTNADEVELFLNGQSLGVKKNQPEKFTEKNTIIWDSIPYQPGKLLAVARTNGKEVARHQIETTGKAVALKIVRDEVQSSKGSKPLSSQLSALSSDGMDLGFYRVYAVDAKGRIVPDATNEVTYEVKGNAATFYAVDNNDHYTNLLFHDVKTKPLTKGQSLLIVRSTRTPGKATIKVTSPTLKSATTTVTSK